jgi:hypothetical protein
MVLGALAFDEGVEPADGVAGNRLHRAGTVEDDDDLGGRASRSRRRAGGLGGVEFHNPGSFPRGVGHSRGVVAKTICKKCLVRVHYN